VKNDTKGWRNHTVPEEKICKLRKVLLEGWDWLVT